MSNYEEEYVETYDIEKTVAQLKEAWECVPNMSLMQLFDELFMQGMTADEVSEALDEFITQNR